MGKCDTCEYLKTIIATLLEDNKGLIDRLMLKNDLPPITPPVVKEEIPTQHELDIESGRAADYGDTE